MKATRSGRRAASRRARGPNILVVHGPNLNLLGTREPRIYGTETLESINRRLSGKATRSGASLLAFQSNSEADLIERLHRARTDGVDFVIINPAAFTHTSIALRDALAATNLAFIEVHLSNVHAREPFRRHSYFSEAAVGVVCGFGSKGYDYALQFALDYVRKD